MIRIWTMTCTQSQQTHKFWAENDDFVIKYKWQITSILNCDHDSIINFLLIFEFYIYNNLYDRFTVCSMPLSGICSAIFWRLALVVEPFRSFPKLKDIRGEHSGSWKCANLNPRSHFEVSQKQWESLSTLKNHVQAHQTRTNLCLNSYNILDKNIQGPESVQVWIR